MTDVSIVRCTPPEWKRFRDIRLRALADSPDMFYHSYDEESRFDENAWRSRLTNPAFVTLLAVRGGGDVGVVTVRPNTWDEHAPEGQYELFGFWVAPQARRQEVARQLLAEAINSARELGAPLVSLWVIGDNEPAERLYESAGFEKTGRTLQLEEPRVMSELEMLYRF